MPTDAPSLGRAREPAVVVLLCALTLGVYFVAWVYRVLAEVRAHAGLRAAPTPRLGAVLAIVPIVNLWVFAGVARDVAALDAQDGEPRLGAPLLFVFYALPVLWPLAIWLTQDALNGHWARHARGADGWHGDEPVASAL